MNRFSAGLDLGKQSDYTALVIAECTGGIFRKRRFLVRYAQRWRGTPYTDLVATICGILSSPPFRDDVRLQIDATGVGQALIDMFDAAKDQGLLSCEVTPITTSAGLEANPIKGTIPKRDLVTKVEVLLSEKRLVFAPDLALAGSIRQELKNFNASITASGRATFAAGGSGHDDLVSALALCVYETPDLMIFSGRGGIENNEAEVDREVYGIATPDKWDDEDAIQRKLAQAERRGLILINGEWQRARCHGEPVTSKGSGFWCKPGAHSWGEQPQALPSGPTANDFWAS